MAAGHGRGCPYTEMLILCRFIAFVHPLVQDKKPPVVNGVGDEHFDPKADQMTRKLINRIGEEEDPHPEAKRTLKADESGKICVTDIFKFTQLRDDLDLVKFSVHYSENVPWPINKMLLQSFFRNPHFVFRD